MTFVMGCYQLSMVGNKIIMTAEGEMGCVLQIHAATKWWFLGNMKMHQNTVIKCNGFKWSRCKGISRLNVTV